MKTYSLGNSLHILFTNRHDGTFTRKTFPMYLKKQIHADYVSYAVLSHGLDVALVDHKTQEILQHADTIMTNDSKLTLSMTVGDCVPIVLYDKSTGAFALIHGGWKNLVKDVVTSSLQSFLHAYDGFAENVNVWIGPSIQKCCNVWKDTRPYDNNPLWNKCIYKKDDGYHVDMQGYIENALLDQGIKSENIVKLTDCTYHEREAYFSHRRSVEENVVADDGRMGIAIWKK